MGRQGSFQTVECSRSKPLGLEWLETQKAAQAGLHGGEEADDFRRRGHEDPLLSSSSL